MTAERVDDYDSTPVEANGFVVDTDAKATWAMRKLRACQDRIDEVEAIAAAEIDRITEWAEREKQQHSHDKTYFTALLTEYARRQREQGRKTVSTPYGKVTSRMGQPNVSYEADNLVAWLKANGYSELVRVRETPDIAEIKKRMTLDDGVMITPDGEIVPSVKVDEPQIKYTVVPQ